MARGGGKSGTKFSDPYGGLLKWGYSELLKLNDFNEMSVPAARTQVLKLTNVASSSCLAS